MNERPTVAEEGVASAADRVLWLAPFCGVTDHAGLDHVLANALARIGADVTVLRCSGLFQSWCPTMTAHGLGADATAREKASVCRLCLLQREALDAEARYRILDLADFIAREDREWAAGVVDQYLVGDSLDFQVDTLPVGRWWCFDAMLRQKTSSIVTDADRMHLRDQALSAALSYRAACNMLTELVVDVAITHTFQYSINRSLIGVMKQAGIPTFSVQNAGSYARPNEYFSVHGTELHHSWLRDPRTPQSMSVPLAPREVLEVTGHIAVLMNGSHWLVYSRGRAGSTASEIRQRLRLSSERSCVVVLTSSPDEVLAGQAAGLQPPGNVETRDLEFLITMLEVARRLPETDFIIRLHPRLFPNSRERVRSPEVDRVLDLLEDLPTNMFLDTPSEGISLYDLVMVADCAVNYRSTAGLEFLQFGIPVVVADPAALYYPTPNSEVGSVEDPAAMAAAIERAISRGGELANVIDAFRWYATFLIRTRVPLTEAVPSGSSDPSASRRSRYRQSLKASAYDALRRSRAMMRLARSLKVRLTTIRRRRQVIRRLEARLEPPIRYREPNSVSVVSLFEEWRSWLSFPESGTAEDEAITLRAALGRLRQDLGCWDGTEGAVAWLTKLDREETRGASGEG